MEKGGQRSGSGAFPRKLDHENPHPHRCPGPSLALHLDRRRGSRQHYRRELLTGRATAGVIADKAYDNNALREFIEDAGAAAIIPSLRSRKILIPHDAVAYKLRNRIERFFNRLKHFRHIATRYDRRAVHFLAALYLASAIIWMR